MNTKRGLGAAAVLLALLPAGCSSDKTWPDDARRPLTDFDLQMLDWSRANGLAVHVLLTKADKLNRGEANTVLKQVRAAVEGVATVQLFSAVAKTGVDDARREVLRMLQGKK